MFLKKRYSKQEFTVLLQVGSEVCIMDSQNNGRWIGEQQFKKEYVK